MLSVPIHILYKSIRAYTIINHTTLNMLWNDNDVINELFDCIASRREDPLCKLRYKVSVNMQAHYRVSVNMQAAFVIEFVITSSREKSAVKT